MLNKRDEEFAQAIVNGLSYSDAFVLAYKPSTDKKTTIAPKASRLANSDAIRARIGQLQERISDKFVDNVSISKAELTSEVLEVARATTTKESDKLKAYGLVASMLGFNIVKSEVSTQSTNINLSFNDLTMSELLKIANMPLVLESPGVIDGSVVDPDSDG